MSRLLWDQAGERSFQTGVDRGVLYQESGVGVVWNGLTGVDEKGAVGATTPLYYDGVKYFDMPSYSEYAATLKAFTYPDEFLEYEGVEHIANGLYMTDQPVKRFGLSYRTRVGNDVDQDLGYKIHLFYNLTVSSNDVSYATIGATVNPMDFSWELSGVPEWVPSRRPTAHFIVDSTVAHPDLLSDLEDILYGTEEEPPRMPTGVELVTLFEDLWRLVTITDNGDGTWTAESDADGVIVMDSATEFTINQVIATYLDPDTYNVSTTPLEP